MPARLGLTRLWRLIRPHGVPVLTLHGILPDPEARFFNATGKFMTPERLERFLSGLGRLYAPISLDDLIAALVRNRSLKNRFVLTFDDGYSNVHAYAYPLLRRMGIPFAIFVTTGMVDSRKVLWNDLLEFALFRTQNIRLRGDLTGEELSLNSLEERRQAIIRLKAVLKRLRLEEAWDEVEKLCDSLGVATDAPELEQVRFLTGDQISEMSQGGVVFGGHSVTHPILSRETRERVRDEVSGCKKKLEALTGKPVTSFAYPNGQPGDFNEMVKDEVRTAGYTAAFTGIRGLARPGGDLFEIKRTLVDCRWTYEEFETRASGIIEAARR
jgi:peptidoglycan/xylan/chitin deacetylase (PgdA/CDA1 family)